MRWRTFLEPASQDVDSYVTLDVGSYDIELKIADCNRNVKLDFTPSTEKQRKIKLRKIARLRTALDATEAAVRAWEIRD